MPVALRWWPPTRRLERIGHRHSLRLSPREGDPLRLSAEPWCVRIRGQGRLAAQVGVEHA
jgi:hypothetical protein